MIVPPGAKIPPLEQRKKRGFCKYHNFLGHKTSQCFLFRDLIQNAIKEGRLKFGEKSKSQMKIDTDPLQVANTNFTEPVDVNMVDVAGFEDGNMLRPKLLKILARRKGLLRASPAKSPSTDLSKILLQVLKGQRLLRVLLAKMSKARLLMVLPKMLKRLRLLKVLGSSSKGL